jgi:hypothetical protein
VSFDWRDRRVGKLEPARAATKKRAASSCKKLAEQPMLENQLS